MRYICRWAHCKIIGLSKACVAYYWIGVIYKTHSMFIGGACPHPKLNYIHFSLLLMFPSNCIDAIVCMHGALGDES